MSSSRDQTIGYLAAAGTVAIWSGFILISRLGGKSALTPYDVLALRLGVAAVLLLPFAGSLRQGAWRNGRLWALGLIGGLLYGVLVYAGFKFVPAAHGAILLPGMQPFLVAAVAWLITRQRIPRERLIGLLFIALGVGFVAQPYILGGTWTAAMLFGDALILASAAVWAVYSVLAKRWGFDPWTLTRFVAISSAALYLPVYALWLPKALDAVPMSTLVVQGLYQGVGATIIAMLLFLKAVKNLGAERVGALIALVPVIAGVAAAPLLGEALTGWLLAGLACVSLGAFVAARPARVTVMQVCGAAR
ncbi:MAG TPA: DMT family transporter [Aromatoleum sp.]|uniref:DMT family transporter n=1 Tax=Aromatoleum sp. TaxID=2307007 RepID=UPI002B4A6F7A|nr:DMT family transporter [Aromatoleum sp.]HJV25396.1 DMT family transporter [Aromatoleum sp.]